MTTTSFAMNRRGFLRALGASGLLVAGGAALTACGTSSESSSNYGVTKGDTKYGTVPMQLGWIKNAQFAGEYFADAKGYYRPVSYTHLRAHET